MNKLVWFASRVGVRSLSDLGSMARVGLLLMVMLAAGARAQAAVSIGDFSEPPVGMPQPPEIAARGFILLDLSTRQVLAARQADQVVPPASLAKIMTAYLTCQAVKSGNLSWSDRLPMSELASQAAMGSGARSLASPGAQLTVADWLQGMAVLGAHDAAVVLAEGVAGSVEEFVARMNRQAQAFGLKSTVFRNPEGATVTGQVSTPRELAWLAVRLLTDCPQTLPYYSQLAITLGGVRQANVNLLLLRDPTVDGLQVAYADRLGYAMAATSRRAVAGVDRRLVAVVVGAASAQARSIEAQKLLNWGHGAFDVVRLYAGAQAVSSAPVWKGRAASVPLGRIQPIVVAVPKGQAARIQTTLTRQSPLMAPLVRGQVVGTLHIKLGAQSWQSLPLQTLEAVPSAGWLGRTWDAIRLGIQ